MKKNIKFEYNGDYYWLKRSGELFIRGRPLGCGYLWVKIVDDELIEKLMSYLEEV